MKTSKHIELFNTIFFSIFDQKIFFAPILLVTRSKCVEKILRKKISWHFFKGIIFRFLRIFSNVCRSEFEWNRNKTKNFVETQFFQNLKMKILINDIIIKNCKNVFAYVSEHCTSMDVSQLKICRLPSPPQKWPSWHRRCAMCWN